MEIAGDSLIVVRDQDGTIRAHHNVCRHRGTRLLEADRGCLSGSIQCPYHAWTYGLDGKLRRAPHMDRVEGFSVEDYPLAAAACEEWGGIVFMRVAEEGPELVEQLGPAGPRLAPWGLAGLRSAHTEHYDLKANWKLVVQNFSECLHCPVIHPQLQPLSHYLSGENYPVTPGAIGSAMDLADGIETLSTDGKLVGALLPELSAADRRLIAYDILLPSVMLCLHPDYVVRYLMRPLAAGRTTIRCDWLFSEETLSRAGFDPARAVEFWHTTNLQDWHVSELAQRGHRLLGLPSRPLLEPRRPAPADRSTDPGTAERGLTACGETQAAQFSRWGLLPHAPCQPDPHRENWASPLSALTRVPPQAVRRAGTAGRFSR